MPPKRRHFAHPTVLGKKNEKMINNYNPQTHGGHLPIRVLQHNLIQWFETASPTILEDMKSEIQFNNLFPGIEYNIVEDKINHLACISEVGDLKVIKLYENFNQFVWCVSYALISIFDEGIQKPIMNNKYTGKNLADSVKPVRGFEVLSAGLSLKNHYSVEIFRKLPNPEIHEENDRFYIEKQTQFGLEQ